MKIYNIFIRHAWKYCDDYYRLEALLDEDSWFHYKNYSVPKHDSLNVKTRRELYRELEEQIAPCSVVIVIAGMYVEYREWIQIEVAIANKYGKPIVVVKPWGAERMPLELRCYPVVNWNTDSIVDAIRRYAL